MSNQINKNQVKDNTLGLKNTDDLIKQILELKNINPNVCEEDILELLTMVSCLKYLEYKETKDVSGAPIYTGLTPEETEIHKRLTEKLNKISKINEKVKEPEPQDISSQITQVYSEIMGKL